MPTGNVAFVLTAHVPYLRDPGRSPVGEDALHHQIATSFIPTLSTLCDLRDHGLQPRVGLAWSPLLLEQLADPVVLKHFGFWLDDLFARLGAALMTYEATGRTERAYLARFYHEWATGIRQAFSERFGRNLIAVLRQLCDDGVIEPLASAATQPAPSTLAQSETRRAQFELGMLAVARRLGRPQGFWLPTPDVDPALIGTVVETGATYAAVDSASLPVGASHLRPYAFSDQRLGVLAHDPVTAPYLYIANLAYSRDPLYRAASRDADGFAWERNGLARRGEAYDPYDAYRRAQEHATHFAGVLGAEHAQFAQTGAHGCSLVALDAGLLGGDWFEGPAWLAALFSEIAGRDDLALVTPAAYLHSQRPRQVLALPGETQRVRRSNVEGHSSLRAAETRLLAVISRMPDASGDYERALQQAARELMLAQTGNAPDAQPAPDMEQRLQRHVSRCLQLCELAELPNLTDANLTLLETLEEQDNPFPYLNYHMFAPDAE